MKFVTPLFIMQERRDIVSLGTAVYQSSRRIQDLLQAVNLFLRDSDKQAVLIVTAGKDEHTDH